MILADAITCHRGRRAVLSNVSLTIAPGELVGVLGANGAGKSTLLATLAGELSPTSGVVRIAGMPLPDWTLAQLATRRAVLPQSPSLGFDLPVRTVIAMGLYPHVRRPFDEVAVLRQAAGLAEVTSLLGRRYRSLSGGEQQRVQFARTLAQVMADRSDGEPRALLLDEPTASLDPRHQISLLAATRRLVRGHQVAGLVILHDVNLAAAWCDRLLLLADGRLVADGPPADVLTAATLESVYRVPVRVVAYPGGATDSRTDPTGGLQATEDGANGDARARLLVLFEPGPAPREG